jgi:hypothetical protein
MSMSGVIHVGPECILMEYIQTDVVTLIQQDPSASEYEASACS